MSQPNHQYTKGQMAIRAIQVWLGGIEIPAIVEQIALVHQVWVRDDGENADLEHCAPLAILAGVLLEKTSGVRLWTEDTVMPLIKRCEEIAAKEKDKTSPSPRSPAPASPKTAWQGSLEFSYRFFCERKKANLTTTVQVRCDFKSPAGDRSPRRGLESMTIASLFLNEEERYITLEELARMENQTLAEVRKTLFACAELNLHACKPI